MRSRTRHPGGRRTRRANGRSFRRGLADPGWGPIRHRHRRIERRAVRQTPCGAGVTRSSQATGAALRRLAALALLAAGLFAAWSPRPADAQGVRIIGGSIARPVANSWTRIASDPQRFRIRPKLVVDPKLRAGTVTGLRSNRNRGLLFVVLSDGSARHWDLERGVQVGGALGEDVVAGAVRGAGRDGEFVSVHSDGSWSGLGRDGMRRSLGGRIDGFDSGVAPTLSSDGSAMAFRTAGRRWNVRKENGERFALPDAARDALAMLSRDGSTIVYRVTGGAMMAARLTSRGVRVVGELDGCKGSKPVTAGALTDDGRRVVLGDARGYICAWDLAGKKGPRRLFRKRDKRRSGAIGALALSGDENHVAAAAENGRVSVWSISGTAQRVAALALDAAVSRPLVLDSDRGWLLTGERDGTVAVHSLKERKRPLIARLISTRRGWSVLDREGRFDGSQSGVEALVWAGETAERKKQELPVDAFSESYFEPGLLAKLDDARPAYLTEEVDDLSEDGYEPPPNVAIDPVDQSRMNPGTRVPVTVRIESGYPLDKVSDIRLYHNGKLVLKDRTAGIGDVARHTVRLVPGENAFRAIGVGANGIEGPPATLVVVADRPAPSEPDMRLVSIGINRYARPSWELFYARDDARNVVSALRERSVDLFRDVQSTTLLDGKADRLSIENRILEPSTSHLDVLVVYFSGHGIGLQDERGWEWYLLPYSSAWRHKEATREEFHEQVRQHGLSSRQLMNLLTKTEAQRVFLILDSCQSGAVVEVVQTDDAVAQKTLRRLARVGGIHVLAASRAHELATELQLRRNGALTYLVLEAIQGKADGAVDGRIDDRVSVREIVEYATREMPNLAARLEQEPISQKPVGYSRGADFALAKF